MNPSLYRPRRTQTPDTGPEVDTSVNYLVIGIVGLLLLMVTFLGMIGFTGFSKPAPIVHEQTFRRGPLVDIGSPPEPSPEQQ